MTPAAYWHSTVQRKLANRLESRGSVVGTEIGLKINSRETRVLDVAVFHQEPDPRCAYFSGGDIAVAIEIVLPRSIEEDYVEKPKEYALLGIPEFWRIDHRGDDLILEIHRLNTGTGQYELTRTLTLDDFEAEG